MRIRRTINAALLGCAALALATPALAQVRQTREQMMFYTADWKGDRYPDGRPKVPDALLERATHVPIEDIWGFLRSRGYN